MLTRVTAIIAACLIGSVGLIASDAAIQQKQEAEKKEAGAETETKIQKKDLPAAVQKAMASEVQGATVKGFTRETEEGKTFYEVETTKNGRGRDLLYDPEGNLVEVEEEVTLDSVPAAVKSALSTQGKVMKIESVTKGGTTVYEAHLEKNGKQSEVKLTPDGKPATP